MTLRAVEPAPQTAVRVAGSLDVVVMATAALAEYDFQLPDGASRAGHSHTVLR